MRGVLYIAGGALLTAASLFGMHQIALREGHALGVVMPLLSLQRAAEQYRTYGATQAQRDEVDGIAMGVPAPNETVEVQWPLHGVFNRTRRRPPPAGGGPGAGAGTAGGQMGGGAGGRWGPPTPMQQVQRTVVGWAWGAAPPAGAGGPSAPAQGFPAGTGDQQGGWDSASRRAVGQPVVGSSFFPAFLQQPGTTHGGGGGMEATAGGSGGQPPQQLQQHPPPDWGGRGGGQQHANSSSQAGL